MRITFLNPSGQIGGAERCLLDLVEGLQATYPEWRLHVIASSGGPFPAAVAKLGIECDEIAMPAAVARLGDATAGATRLPRLLGGAVLAARPAAMYMMQIRKALARQAPDIVQTNGLKMHAICAVARPASSRLVWHLHDFVSSRPLMAPVLRASARRCSVAVANSMSVADDLGSVCGARLEVRTILNGVDLNRFSVAGNKLDLDALSGMHPTDEGALRVGLIATMAPWKGHEVFLRAIASIPRETPLRAYVIGDRIYETATPQRSLSELRDLAGRLGIGNRVGFTGQIADVPSAMRALDVVVSASTQPEPFGLVIAEAMACGRAVAASAATGAGEIFSGQDRDKVALWHSPGDIDALALNIETLCRNDALRRSMGAEARRQAECRFDKRRFCREFAETYQELVESPSWAGRQ